MDDDLSGGFTRIQVYALSRDGGIPGSRIWRKIHPKYKVPVNAVWLSAFICALLGLPILAVDVVFTAITSICTIGWVGGYAVPIFARMIMEPEDRGLSSWVDSVALFAWWRSYGYATHVQSSCFPLPIPLNLRPSTMPPLLWALFSPLSSCGGSSMLAHGLKALSAMLNLTLNCEM